jgi:hypothetical protein
MATYLITTDRGGPLYFRETFEAAERFRREWQADLDADAAQGLHGARVVVSASDDD